MDLPIGNDLSGEGYELASLPPFLAPIFFDVMAAKARELTALVAEHRARTLDECLQRDGHIKRKAESGGIVLPDTSFFEQVINPGVAEFLRIADENGFPYQVWLHPPSKTKLDAGYSPEEVAITLAYAPDEARTYYLIF